LQRCWSARHSRIKGVDGASKRFVVQVTDSSTGEVILKFPGDAVLRVAQNIESMKGVLFDEVL